jgi:peptide/nickel transport system substrate-binding protein
MRPVRARELFLFFLLVDTACRARESAVPSAAEPTPAPEAVLGYIDESREGIPVRGGALHRRLYGDPTTLNAVLQSGLPEQQVLQYVSRNLLDFDARMNLVPGLAESFDASPDGKVFTFRIRPEAVWEDGTPVTARDAVFTIERITDEKVSSPVFEPVFDSLESVEALAEKSFRVRFRDSYAQRAMAFVLPLLPEKRFVGKPFAKAPDNRAPFSNGPYRFVRWKPQESLELERNPRYWGSPGHFDRIVFKVLPEDSVAYRALLDGSLDETLLDATLKARSAVDARFAECCRLVEFYNLDYTYIALNHRAPFFADPRVRRAMTLLLDRAAIARGIFGGSARIISGPWAPDSPAYDARVVPLPFDPPGASALLSEAGWRDTDGDGTRDKGGKKFVFEILTSSGSVVGRQIDETFAAELGRAGVTARVRPLEWAAFIERVGAGDFEAASLGWSASDPNPDPYPYWHSSQIPPDGLNSGYYSNPQADRWMEEARREMEPEKQVALYHRLHLLFRDDAPAVFVVNTSKKYAFRRRVRGLVTSPLGFSGMWPGPVGWWAAGGAEAAGP